MFGMPVVNDSYGPPVYEVSLQHFVLCGNERSVRLASRACWNLQKQESKQKLNK